MPLAATAEFFSLAALAGQGTRTPTRPLRVHRHSRPCPGPQAVLACARVRRRKACGFSLRSGGGTPWTASAASPTFTMVRFYQAPVSGVGRSPQR